MAEGLCRRLPRRLICYVKIITECRDFVMSLRNRSQISRLSTLDFRCDAEPPRQTTLPLSALSALLLLMAPAAAAQPAVTTLWSFSGPDGATPYGGLIRDRLGNLYGVTSAGGASNAGHAFELSPPAAGGTAWTMMPVWDFSGADGSYSETTLLRDTSGNLYGTMVYGGASNDGVVFELSPPPKKPTGQPWTEKTLWSFSGTDAANPYNGLAADTAGNLYGATPYGGSNGIGAVYELSPPTSSGQPWTETTLWSFVGPEGQTPVGVPLLDTSGNVYGAAQWGGVSNAGTIYELSPPAIGQGPWSVAALSTFAGGSADGMTPYPQLLPIGRKVYGTTLSGGPSNAGTVFQMVPAKSGGWTRNTIWSFSFSDGCCAFGKLLSDQAGALYGTTGFGGPANAGTVFKLTPPATGQTAWTETVLWSFTGGQDGGNPGDALIVDQNGTLYGTTSAGGANNKGTIFSLTGSGFTVKMPLR